MAENEIRAVDEPLPPSSKAPSLYLIVVIALSVIPTLALISAGILSWAGKPIPDIFGPAINISLTALAGMVAYQVAVKAAG